MVDDEDKHKRVAVMNNCKNLSRTSKKMERECESLMCHMAYRDAVVCTSRKKESSSLMGYRLLDESL